MKYIRGSILELSGGAQVEFLNYCANPHMIRVANLADPKRKPQSIFDSFVKQVISTPLPLEVGDRVIDQDDFIGEIISICDRAITIKKPDMVTSHNLDYGLPNLKKLPKQSKVSPRGGKREGAGRKPTGNPPKKRKAIQLDEAIAAKLPDLKILAQLLDEFRPIAESGQLRSQKLADFYKKLDSLPTIL